MHGVCYHMIIFSLFLKMNLKMTEDAPSLLVYGKISISQSPGETSTTPQHQMTRRDRLIQYNHAHML